MAVNKGIFVRLHAKADKGDVVADFLKSAQAMAMAEAGTTAWFAVRFGPTEFAIFDVFADDAGRDAHLSGPIAQALMANAEALLAQPPKIEKVDVLASKL